jgi:putative membrane protein
VIGPVSPASGPRRRTHRLSPVVSAVRSVGILLGVLVVFGNNIVRDVASELGWGAGLAVLILGLVVVGALILAGHHLAWTRTEFFFDETGDFRLDSGILQRQERRIALSRLQSVDVVRPLLGRIVGLSQLRIEVAGTGDSRVLLSYLADSDAQALRAEIIARAAGVSPEAGEAPEQVLAVVPTSDLVVSLLLRSETFALLAVSVLVVIGAVVTEGPGGLTLLLLTGGIPIISVFTQFMRYFGFTVAESPDGLRLRHGLASVQSQTVPPGRVQAVEVSEPLLWRRRGWVRVNLNVAGLQLGQDEGQAEHVLLPVAPREVAAGILARVLPGVDLTAHVFTPAPPRARRRAWLQWGNLGVAVDDRVLATRRGFLTRYTALIPHARTQSVGVTQGPWQRWLDLASVRVDTTPGPVAVVGLHRDSREARGIAEAQLARAARARATGPQERWMTPPPAADGAQQPPQRGVPSPPAPVPPGAPEPLAPAAGAAADLPRPPTPAGADQPGVPPPAPAAPSAADPADGRPT